MSVSITKSEVFRLYKNLMNYSKALTYTDPVYFRKRVAKEFKKNKNLDKLEDIQFAYQVRLCLGEDLWSKMLKSVISLRPLQYLRSLQAFKHTIDYSRVPKINEHDLSEQFVRGSGPGGSAVNKNANCVVLTHIPTGTVVKCHISRSQDENRKLAREMLIARLDEEINGADSVTAQKRRLEEKKMKRNEYKKKKVAQLKSEFKKREGLT